MVFDETKLVGSENIVAGEPASAIDSAAQTMSNLTKHVGSQNNQLPEQPVEPEFTFPTAELPESLTGGMGEDLYAIQPALRMVGAHNIQGAVPDMGTAIANEVQDFGLTSTAMDLVSDSLETDDKDDNFHVLQKGVGEILEKYNLPDGYGDELLNTAKNLNHADTLAQRAQRRLLRASGRDNMSLAKTLAVGVGGFVVDPINFVPGAILLKGAGYTTKFIATEALRSTTLRKTATNVTGMSAFGAAEEAFRTAPRLATDITFNYDEYMQQVGYGALLGGGIMGAVPVGKFALNKTLQGIQKSTSKLAQAVSESNITRTGTNVLATAATASSKVRSTQAVKDMLKNADVGRVVREARDKANKQVAESKAIKSMDNLTERFVSSLKDIVDPTKAVLAFTDNVKSVVAKAVPEGKFKETINTLNDKIDSLGKPVDQTPKAGGSAGRKTTPQDKTADVKQDIKDTLAEHKESVTKTKQQIADVEKEALDALDTLPASGARNKARLAIKAAGNSARRALDDKATRSGLKLKRKASTAAEIATSSSKTLNKTIQSLPYKEMQGLINKLGLGNATSLDRIISNVTASMNMSGLQGSDLSEAIITWINKNPKLAKEKATHVRDLITREHNKALDNLEDLYTGNPSDKDFLRAKQILKESRDRLEAVSDWMGMLHSNGYNDLVRLDPEWALLSQSYEEGMGAANRAILQEQYDQLAQRMISKQFGTLTESQSAKLVRTGVPLAEWMALNILELPAGTGGVIARNETAAILSQIMEAELQVPLNKAWFAMMDEAAEDLGYGWIKREFLRTQGANTSPLVEDIAKKVMLEMNQRQQGMSAFESKMPNYVKRFADKLEETNDKAYKLQLDNNVDGITGHNQMNAYMKQAWNDGAIMDMITNPSIGKDNVVLLLGESLHSRAKGALTRTEASDLAESVIATKLDAINKPQVDSFNLRSDNLANSMDSVENIIEHLKSKGSKDSLEAISKYIQSTPTGMPTYAHKRFLNLDYTTTITRNGESISIMDLLDKDVIANANRYNKEAAGRSAISKASGGRLNSDETIQQFIGAMGTQANEMGTHVNTQEVRNVFKQMLGLPFDGVLPMNVRKIRDAVSLAGMNGLGESQLAELGLSLNRGLAGILGANQVASKMVGQAKQFMGMQLTEAQQKNTKFLNELQEFSRLYEDMHHLARNNVHFDTSATQGAETIFDKFVNAGTGGKYRPTLQYLQTRGTLYSAIRTMEEQLSMAGLMQDAVKAVQTGRSYTSTNRFKDVGLDLDLINRKINDGSITLNPDGTIDALNMHQWSIADNYTLGVALRRHSGQQVQMSFAGEMSPLMTNPQVAMLMQFKSYPMLAAEKQMARNVMFGDKEAAMGIVLNAASSAGARYVRYMSLAQALPDDKREAYINRRLNMDMTHDTAAYMGIVGMMVNNKDLVEDVVFGNSSIASQIPVVNWADNYLKAVKAAGRVGDLSERDIGTMQRGAPLGTVAQVNVISGVLRNMMETDVESNKPQRFNRGN